MKYRKIVILLVILLSICFIIKPTYGTGNKQTSIYMWEVKNIDYETYDKMVDYLNINKIYAYVGTANLNNKIDSEVKILLEFAKRKNIDIYLVYDENYEDQTENERRIKEFIEEIKEYNNTSTYKIKGLAIDSEFHCLDGYSSLSKDEQIDLFRRYVNAMKNSYTSAKEANLEYVVCIPVWLNKLDETLLETLIKDGSSYVQLMNYNINNMVNNIKEEVAFAEKYNKKIENIAEFQIPGPHEVTEDDTFYDEGLEAGIDKFKEIDEHYNYDLLTFSYHYYKPVIELYKKLDIKEEKVEDKNEEQKQEEDKSKNETENKASDDNKEVNKNENQDKKDNEINNNQEKGDDTKAKGYIPQTGENVIIYGLAIIAMLVAIVSLIKIIKRK